MQTFWRGEIQGHLAQEIREKSGEYRLRSEDRSGAGDRRAWPCTSQGSLLLAGLTWLRTDVDLVVQLRDSKGVGSLAAALLGARVEVLKSGRRVLKCRVVVVIVGRR
jgi:hypothetical protein